MEMRMLRGARYAGTAVAGAAGSVARGAGWVGHKLGEATHVRRKDRELDSPSTDTDS